MSAVPWQVASGVGLSANDMMPVDNDPAVITLEDALMRLDEDDELENCQSNQPGMNYVWLKWQRKGI